jgi:hypothetical protein
VSAQVGEEKAQREEEWTLTLAELSHVKEVLSSNEEEVQRLTEALDAKESELSEVEEKLTL